MDRRLLKYYDFELKHLREMGAEFAREFPRIASGLGMKGLEVHDPYVERLLEGVAFLAARVHLKMDAEFPRFTQALLEMVYPQYLAPTPSMLVAQMMPDPKDPNLPAGFTVPRASTLLGLQAPGSVTACEFRTAQDVTLWPAGVASASYFSYAPDLPLNALPVTQTIKGGLRIVLKDIAGLPFRQMALDKLVVYLAGHDDIANHLYELCMAANLGVLVSSGTQPTRVHTFLGPASIRPVGFADGESLLPVTSQSLHGYRLLQEYFAFPQRYRFFEMSGLQPAVRRCDSDELEISVLFSRGNQSLEGRVDASTVALHCTPAINLFAKHVDRIQVNDSAHEHHVVPDRTRPLDFEVYEVTAVKGHGVGAESEQPFRPFYCAHAYEGDDRKAAYFTTRREPRLVTAAQKQRGTRSDYVGSEVFLSLVDPAEAPYAAGLKQLSVETLCSNRDLPTLGKGDCHLDVAAPVTRIHLISGPSDPRPPLAEGSAAWRAISHLALNYLSIVDRSPHEGATALRSLLELYAPGEHAAARKQVEGVRSVKASSIVRRVPAPGPIAFGRGIEVVVEVDELAFEGGSAFLLGSVLEQYFARHASINSFTQTVLRSQGRGEINRWAPQWGVRPTL